jgi:CBS domain-containing membrane protein
MDDSITSIMSKDPVCLTRTEKVSDAWRVLTEGRFHHLPVVEDGRVVGMLSVLDIAKLGLCPMEDGHLLTRQVLDSRLSIEQLMQSNVVSVAANATVRDAARLLSAGGFHALPVVDDDDRLVGIVTTTDLIGYLLRLLSAEPEGGREDADPRAAAACQSVAKLRAVCDAAEAYVRSGLAEHEHAVLVRALDAARRRDDLFI